MPKSPSPSPDPLLAAIGRRVRSRREVQGLTRRDLAERTGLSERFLAQVETGQGNIAVTRLAGLARALGSTAAELAAEPEPAPDQRRILALLGFRGAGKTSLGTRVAKRLRIPFIEHDDLVSERAGLPLAEVFRVHGETYFRRLAQEVLDPFFATSDGPLLLATCGGLVTDLEAFDLTLRHCHTVWLQASAQDHWSRVVAQGDRRPMRDRPDARTELRGMLDRRDPLYGRAEQRIDTSACDENEAAERLEKIARALLL